MNLIQAINDKSTVFIAFYVSITLGHIDVYDIFLILKGISTLTVEKKKSDIKGTISQSPDSINIYCTPIICQGLYQTMWFQGWINMAIAQKVYKVVD